MRSDAKHSTREPFFSIIVPVWNRQESITRCLNSVSSQDFDDYEIVVVDDASDDDTLTVLRRREDPRLRVLQHDSNRGVCAARHSATAASRGRWVLSLDSDWELLPGALKILAKLGRESSPEVGLIGAYAKSDRGEIWPGNPLPERPFGFHDYLRWMDTSKPSDFLSCRRREVFKSISWPTDRRLEKQFNLRVAKAWHGSVISEVLALAYTDCPNRYFADATKRGIERKLERAADEAKAREEILQEFGADLKQRVPRVYFNMVAGAARDHFCAGHRLSGLKYALLNLLQKPWKAQIYVQTFAGLMGPRAMVTLGRSKSVRWLYRLVTT